MCSGNRSVDALGCSVGADTCEDDGHTGKDDHGGACNSGWNNGNVSDAGASAVNPEASGCSDASTPNDARANGGRCAAR